LKLGARVSEERPGGGLGTSVHRAAAHGHTEALKELLGADGKTALKLFDDMGRTPLICAVQEGHLEEACLILNAGANVNARHEQTISNTALATAVQERNLSMVELLLEHGADPTIKGWMQLSALDRARDWSADDADAELRRIFDLLNNAAKLGKRASQ
jgi:ankyrin repeat protein